MVILESKDLIKSGACSLLGLQQIILIIKECQGRSFTGRGLMFFQIARGGDGGWNRKFTMVVSIL